MSFHQPGKFGGEISVITSWATFPIIPEPEVFSGILGTLPITFKLFTTTSLRFVRFEETVSAVSFVLPNRLKPTQEVYLLLLSGWVKIKTVKQKMDY